MSIAGRSYGDLSGTTLGRLTVLRFSHNKSYHNFWLCKCICGNELIVKRSALTRKKEPTRSCGCIQREFARSMCVRIHHTTVKLASGESALRKLYYTYKKSASKRILEFSLSKDEFKDITSKSCVYCGIAPLQKYETYANGSVYYYNGIDRVNNDIGYTVDNSVPCCFRCNSAKRTDTHDVFLQWVENVYNNSIKGKKKERFSHE